MKITNTIHEIEKNMVNYPNSVNRSLLKYNAQKLFNILMKEEEKKLLSDNELRKTTLSISSEYGNLAAKINNMPKNREAIMKTMERLDNEISNKLDGYYAKYAIQWGLSVKALWHYRNNDFLNAVELTRQCIELIDELIVNGMFSLVFRNIEQNKNLSFIERKKNQIKSGDLINGDMLKYYFIGKTKRLYGVTFNDSNLWSEMPYLRESFGYMYFRDQVEVYHKMITTDLRRAKQFYRCVFSKIKKSTPDTLERYLILSWIHIQELFFAEDYNNFIKETNVFLEDRKKIFFDGFKRVLLDQLRYIVNSSTEQYEFKKQFEKLVWDYETTKLSSLKSPKFNGGTRKAKIE